MLTPPNNLREDLRRLYGHVPKTRRRQLFVVLSLMMLGAMGELLTLGAILPFLALLSNPAKAASYPGLQSFFSLVGWTDPEQIVVPVTILFAMMVLSAGGIRLLLAWETQRFVLQVGHDLGVEVYRRVLYQPYLYHASKNTSDVIATTNKVDDVVYGVLLQLMQLLTSLVISLFIVAALVAIDPVVALSAAAGFGAIYLGITYLVRGRVQANSRIWAGAQGERVKALQEGLGGIRDVLIDQTQTTFVDRFADVDRALRQAQGANAFIGAAPRFMIEACGMVLIATMALVLSREGGLVAALPVLGALALGAQKLLPLLQYIYNSWTSLAGQHQSLVDVLAVLDLPMDPPEAALEPVRPLAFKREIVLQHVHFQYAETRPLVLRDIALKIEKGSRVGFIGKTGSGKSTIVDLIMGLLQPTSGQVKIDGVLLTSENLRGWQAQIAHVPQAIYLADASIASNIAFGVTAKNIDLVRVRAAAQQAELAEFVERLPEKYDTAVGERGIRLSGGQRQRIGIARALYKGASVLIFDEATSALDNETEAAVMKAIEGLRRDLTVIIIAHRLSTVAVCDTVIRLENGRIVGEGSYADMVTAYAP